MKISEVLELERIWWQLPGSKEESIRERFDISAVRYYQLLNVIIETPEALAVDPLLVNRLRRIRNTERAKAERRRGVRSALTQIRAR